MLFLLFLIISLNLIQAQEINAEVEIKDEGFLAVLKYVFSFKWLTEGVFGDTSEYGVKYCDKNLDCKDYKCKKGTAYCSDLNGECSCKEETPTDITEESGITNDEQNLIEDELLTEIPPEEPSNCEPECSYNQVCISKELDETEPNFWSSLYNFLDRKSVV